MDFLPLVLVVGGVALGVVGYLSLTERLPRNGYAGVRTPSTMRSDTAFRVGNKAAGLPTLVGGIVALAGAVVGWSMPTGEALLVVVMVATIAMLALVVAGGVLGVRAARAVGEEER
ncbi:SdpI family protein [Saccharothrix isguenensis]